MMYWAKEIWVWKAGSEQCEVTLLCTQTREVEEAGDGQQDMALFTCEEMQ